MNVCIYNINKPQCFSVIYFSAFVLIKKYYPTSNNSDYLLILSFPYV